MDTILRVTLEELAAVGFERLSVPEVAALAGVNKTSVYRRWPTKEDLVRDALSTSMGHGEALPDTGSLRGDMLQLARTALRFVESPVGKGALRTLLAEGPTSLGGDLATALVHRGGTTGPRQVFERAIARGELSVDADVPLVLSIMAGALMHRIMVEDERVSDAYLERLVDLLLGGLAPRPTPSGARARAPRETARRR